MYEVWSTRIELTTKKEILEVMKELHADRSTVVRLLLEAGVREWRKNRALKALSEPRRRRLTKPPPRGAKTAHSKPCPREK